MADARQLHETVARNVRELRRAAGLTLPELAERSGLGRSTLASLEAGSANPSVETLWAVSAALEVPFARLVDPPQPAVRFLRAGEGVDVRADSGLAAKLLASRPRRGAFEVFMLAVDPPAVHGSPPHMAGTVEHLLGIAGRLRCGPEGAEVELGRGDLLTFEADVPHGYEGLRSGTRALLVMDYP
jgi:transcriptional regulator with XRE-family HTH domain